MRHAVIGYCACELTSLAGSAFASSVERRLASLVRGAGALEAGDLRSPGDRVTVPTPARDTRDCPCLMCRVWGARWCVRKLDSKTRRHSSHLSAQTVRAHRGGAHSRVPRWTGPRPGPTRSRHAHDVDDRGSRKNGNARARRRRPLTDILATRHAVAVAARCAVSRGTLPVPLALAPSKSHVERR